MKIDGKAIAERMLTVLIRQVGELQQRGITPTLAVILVGNNPASLSYIKQKQKAAETIGAKLILRHQPATVSRQLLQSTIVQFNSDSAVHGLIVQRPLPKEIGDGSDILHSVNPEKDVDGFLPDSPFTPPVAGAVLEILKAVSKYERRKSPSRVPFDTWLKQQCSVVLGRGETAGRPIAKVLQSHGCTIEVVHSKTPHPEVFTKKFDIIVSCVGKERVITADMVTPRSILIGVGLWRDRDGKLRGDYDEDEIADVVAYYTPTPGGVGPVNVAFLMQNLVTSCMMRGKENS